MGGGGGGGGPTVQQQQLATEQAMTNANLNLEENAQRKTILNSMQGTRVFRGSALSRAMRGNTNQPGATSAPSAAQVRGTASVPKLISSASLLGGRNSVAQNAVASPGHPATISGTYGGITAPNARRPA